MTSGYPIERLTVSILSAPVDSAVPMSFGTLTDRRVCLVEVEAGGVVGIGESWLNYPGWSHAERLSTFTEGIAPLVFGLDASDPAGVLALLCGRLLPVGRQAGAIGPIWQALSGIDIALWDIAGKLAGKPVHELLTGTASRSSVPAYASGIGPSDIESLCAVALADGYRAIKTKIGFGAERDRATLSTARDCVGAEIELFADANQAWDVAAATEQINALADYDVRWIEEPLAGDRVEDLQKLAAAIPLPIATGENVYGTEDFESRIGSGAVTLIQPDLAKSGGFTIARAVAESANRSDVRIAPHCYSSGIGIAASAQFGAAYDRVDWIEMDVRPNPLRTELLARGPELSEGAIHLPTSPGLGVELDPATVRRFRIHREERTRNAH
ncbi:mandelate racemase/muconate lactonizing enzyme family protein [Nocardia sp. NPDC019395]|uniref:mandelate racemase/muconate lactonizing enzyme family protein n=1 Tax=Nocardia sp. NPDC019395 TaxID=3154686 RepID=UPI0033DCCB99